MNYFLEKENTGNYFATISNDKFSKEALDYIAEFDKYLRINQKLSGINIIDMIYSVEKDNINIDSFLEGSDKSLARTLHLALMYEFDVQIGIGSRGCKSYVIEDLFDSIDSYNVNDGEGTGALSLLCFSGAVGLSNNVMIKDDKVRLGIARVYFMTLQHEEDPVSDYFLSSDDVNGYLCAYSRSQIIQRSDEFKAGFEHSINVPEEIKKITSPDFFTLEPKDQDTLLRSLFKRMNEDTKVEYGEGIFTPFAMMALAARWPVEHIRTTLILGGDVNHAIKESEQVIRVILDISGLDHDEIAEKSKNICMLALLPYPQIFKSKYPGEILPIDIAFTVNDREGSNDYSFPYYSGIGFDVLSSEMGLTHNFVRSMSNDYGYGADLIVNAISKSEPDGYTLNMLSKGTSGISSSDANEVISRIIPGIKEGHPAVQVRDLLWIEETVRIVDNDNLKFEYNKAIIDHASINTNYANQEPIPSMLFSKNISREFMADYIMSSNINIDERIMRSGGFKPSDLAKNWKSVDPGVKSRVIQKDLGM